MTITEAIETRGLEYLRGRAVTDGLRILFINERDLDRAIMLWGDEPEKAYLQRRFYGSAIPNEPLHCVWIHGSFAIVNDEAASSGV
ncbi:MAG: hypothetical protein K8H75_17920 [Sulfuricella sp.]|nr:hypothetical protein [Sulfuricella sp.]